MNSKEGGEKMVRKQGGLLNVTFLANENVVDRCLQKVREVEPDSLADKLYHITIKTGAYVEFVMDGFEYTTDGAGNFSSIALGNMKTAEIHDVHFKKPTDKCVICFIY